jgi:hypothetical protein
MIRFCPLSPLIDLSMCQILLVDLLRENRCDSYIRSPNNRMQLQKFIRLYMLYFLLDQPIINLDDQFENEHALITIANSYQECQNVDGSLLFYASSHFVGCESIKKAISELFLNSLIKEKLYDILRAKNVSEGENAFQIDMRWAAIANASQISDVLSSKYGVISIQRTNNLFDLFLDIITSSIEVPKRKQKSVLWQVQCSLKVFHTINQVSCSRFFAKLFHNFEYLWYFIVSI